MNAETTTAGMLGQMWWGDHMSGWGGGWMWLWGTLMVLAWVVIIAAAIWFLMRTGAGDPGKSRAERLLDERFARGELDQDEYRERKTELRR